MQRGNRDHCAVQSFQRPSRCTVARSLAVGSLGSQHPCSHFRGNHQWYLNEFARLLTSTVLEPVSVERAVGVQIGTCPLARGGGCKRGRGSSHCRARRATWGGRRKRCVAPLKRIFLRREEEKDLNLLFRYFSESVGVFFSVLVGFILELRVRRSLYRQRSHYPRWGCARLVYWLVRCCMWLGMSVNIKYKTSER